MGKTKKTRLGFLPVGFSSVFIVTITIIVVIIPALIFLLDHFGIVRIPNLGFINRNQTQVNLADQKIILPCPIRLIPCPLGTTFKSPEGFFGVRYEIPPRTNLMAAIDGNLTIVTDSDLPKNSVEKIKAARIENPKSELRLVYTFEGDFPQGLSRKTTVAEGEIIGVIGGKPGHLNFTVFAFYKAENVKLYPNKNGTLEIVLNKKD